MLNRTTSILPEGLFASLGVPRADENLRDVKHGLDDDLRRACEEVISSCVNPLCEPLDEWVMRVRTYSRSQQPSDKGGVPASGSAAPPGSTAGVSTITSPAKVKDLYEQFRLKTERDLRANAARIKLYLGEQPTAEPSLDGPGEGSSTPNPSSNRPGAGGGGRTARVLIEHVRERVWEGYRGFFELVKEVALAVAVGAGDGDVEREREWREAVKAMEREDTMREVLAGVCGL